MITRSQFETLVESVLARLNEEAPATVANSDVNPKRYRNDGTSTDEPAMRATGTAKTQMPPTVAPPTVPAPKSPAEQEAAADGLGSSTITRNPQAAPPTQKTIKVNAIRKALDKSGFTGTPEGAKFTTANLNGWYDKLDPSEALISTADQLAQRFASGE